jgi:hypothetical protein
MLRWSRIGYDKSIIRQLQTNTIANHELVGRSDLMSVDIRRARAHDYCVFTSPLWGHDNDCYISIALLTAVKVAAGQTNVEE